MKSFPQPTKLSLPGKLLVLIATFLVIGLAILGINAAMPKATTVAPPDVSALFEDGSESVKVVLEKTPVRRTVAEFRKAIIDSQSAESRLIVHSVELSDTISLANEGLGGWKLFSTYQDVTYHGTAVYTVNLSKLTEEDFAINYETKQISVRIPFVELEPINIPADKIEFHEVDKGMLASSAIKMTPEQSAQLQTSVSNLMKAKLIDQNVADDANRDAQLQVAELFSKAVAAVDPEYQIMVVQ